MNINIIKQYKNVLIINSGGCELLCSIALSKLLIANGAKVDVGCILNPCAEHIFDTQTERIINVLGAENKRFILNTEIQFIDNFIPKTADAFGVRIGHYYEFSLKFGLTNLLKELTNLISSNEYDVVIGFDVGGDILGSEAEPVLLTPIMDNALLQILGNLYVDTFLFMMGIGTDGELSLITIDKTLKELKQEKITIEVSEFDKQYCDMIVQLFETNKHIQFGEMAEALLKTLKYTEEEKNAKNAKNICQDYSVSFKVIENPAKDWKVKTQQYLMRGLYKSLFVLDAKKFYNSRKNSIIRFDDILECQIKYKNRNPAWKTELDTYYLQFQDIWHGSKVNAPLYLLTPSTILKGSDRKEFLRAGIEHAQIHSYTTLMLADDFKSCESILKQFKSEKVGNFVVILMSETNMNAKILSSNVCESIHKHSKN